jgi:hypothetical protein
VVIEPWPHRIHASDVLASLGLHANANVLEIIAMHGCLNPIMVASLKDFYLFHFPKPITILHLANIPTF